MFPSCDRILVPLDGSLRLDVAGARREAPKLGVLRFRGEDDVRAVDVTQPTTDLNVIVARDRGRVDLAIDAAQGSHYVPEPGQRLLVVALSGEILTDVARLAHRDAALLETGQALFVERGLVAVITINDLSGSAELG